MEIALNDDRPASALTSEINIRESPDGDFASFGTNETKVANELDSDFIQIEDPWSVARKRIDRANTNYFDRVFMQLLGHE